MFLGFVWSLQVTQLTFVLLFHNYFLKIAMYLTSVRVKESNWAISMRALWFFIYQPDMRKHWQYAIPLRNLGALKAYHQKYRFSVILKGVIETALKHWREGLPLLPS